MDIYRKQQYSIKALEIIESGQTSNLAGQILALNEDLCKKILLHIDETFGIIDTNITLYLLDALIKQIQVMSSLKIIFNNDFINKAHRRAHVLTDLNNRLNILVNDGVLPSNPLFDGVHERMRDEVRDQLLESGTTKLRPGFNGSKAYGSDILVKALIEFKTIDRNCNADISNIKAYTLDKVHFLIHEAIDLASKIIPALAENAIEVSGMAINAILKEFWKMVQWIWESLSTEQKMDIINNNIPQGDSMNETIQRASINMLNKMPSGLQGKILKLGSDIAIFKPRIDKLSSYLDTHGGQVDDRTRKIIKEVITSVYKIQQDLKKIDVAGRDYLPPLEALTQIDGFPSLDELTRGLG